MFQIGYLNSGTRLFADVEKLFYVSASFHR